MTTKYTDEEHSQKHSAYLKRHKQNFSFSLYAFIKVLMASIVSEPKA